MTRQCVEKATVADVADPGTLLNSFFWMKARKQNIDVKQEENFENNGFKQFLLQGNPVALRQSADAAVLLVANLNIRGVGNGDVNAIR